GSPLATVPKDHFSARFTKNIRLSEAKTYIVDASADDGVRVSVDGKVVIDGWNSGPKQKQAIIDLEPGDHAVQVEYYEILRGAYLKVNLKEIDQKTLDTAEVGYNWGYGGPSGLPTDNFKATFNQTKSLTAGDYFVQTFADDGVKVTANKGTASEKILVDRFTSFTNKVDQTFWLGVPAGDHKITTDYLELANEAAVFSNVVPFGSWLAYYYDNTSLKGLPKKSKVIAPTGQFGKLSEDNGTG
ncbi:hypothetical protein GH741_21405, partial [Aquibacillus halophilus]